MKPKMIWSNLAVSDLDRTTRFYTTLGFKPNGSNQSNELRSFLFGQNDFVINFFVEGILEKNTKIEIPNAQKVNEVVFTLSADSKEEVNLSEKEVEKAGGKIISKPEEFGKGYYGFLFADPDGHKFNVFYMKNL